MWQTLGWMARFSAWSSRYRQPVVPAPVWALLFFLCVFLGGLANYAEAGANDPVPQRVTPAQLLTNQGVRQDFIQLSGTPLAEHLGSLVPYSDSSGAVVYVRPAHSGPESTPVGMLHFTNAELESAMPADSATRRHVRNVYLVAGEAPASALPALLVMGVSALLGLPLLITLLLRSVVFRAGVSGGEGAPGILAAGRVGAASLLHQPVTLVDDALVSESGERLPLCDLSAPRPGVLYLGAECRPALQLRAQGDGKQNRRLTLSFGDAAVRDQFAESLSAATP